MKTIDVCRTMCRAVLAGIFAAAVFSGCAVGLKQVTDVQLAALTDEQRAALGPLNDEHATQVTVVTARRAEEKEAEREVNVVRHEVRCAEAHAAIAKLRYDAAMETKNADTMLPARATLAEAEHALAVARATLTFRIENERYAEALLGEAEAALEVIVSKREMARFDAVAEAQKLSETVKSEERAGYLNQMASAEQGHADARRTLVAAEAVMKQAQERLRRTQAKSTTPAVEPAVPAPAAEPASPAPTLVPTPAPNS